MAVLAAVAVTRDGRREVAPTSPTEAPRASPAEAAAALAAFVGAVGKRDLAVLERLAPADMPAAEELLSGIAANVRTLDITAVTARYVDQMGTVSADGSWTGVAELTWQLRGFDERPARSDVAVRFVPDGDGLGIARFEAPAADGGRLPLWLRGRLSVARASDVLVMADGPASVAEVTAKRAVRGIDVVRRVLPDWRSPVVVEVPASAAELDETLGAEPGTYADIAAVTAPVGLASDIDGPVHVFVNRDVSDGLRRAGAQVVMSHELVHVATDAVRRPVKPWLAEGFADYVALRDVTLPDRVTLARAMKYVRREGVPRELPTAEDFNARGKNLQAQYELAWLACRVVADQVGERALVAFHTAARRGSVDVELLLRRRGLPPGILIELWRTLLDRAASAPIVRK